VPAREAVASALFLDAIPLISPDFKPPYHLHEWTDLFEEIALGHPVRALCAVPIRHWKTQTTLHGIAWLLTKNPTTRFLLLTHSHERAAWLGKRLRQLCEAAGVGPERGQNTITDWATEQGGGAIVMSAEQSKLGYDCHCLIFDDPQDENASQDYERRNAADECISLYTARCMRDGKPGPVIGIMSRWHPDDMIGRRIQRSAKFWRYIHHAAIEHNDAGQERAFAPEVWPLDELRQMREELREVDPTEQVWQAQLMNDPKPAGGAKFDVTRAPRWNKLPDWSFRLAYGVDLAFTSGETGDYFALVALKVFGTDAYVIDVQRHKIEAHLIESTCKAMLNKYGRGPFFSYVSGPEVGTVRLMRERGLPFMPMKARYNKLVRAERTIARWNASKIHVPSEAPWLSGFLHRAELFQGNEKDRNDDEIDALVAVCDGALGSMVGGAPKTLGRAYPGMMGRG